MAKLTYDEIMKLVDEKLTPELIEGVIKEMGLEEEVKYCPDRTVERMHLENDIQIIIGDWIDNSIEKLSLKELKEMYRWVQDKNIDSITIKRPEEK